MPDLRSGRTGRAEGPESRQQRGPAGGDPSAAPAAGALMAFHPVIRTICAQSSRDHDEPSLGEGRGGGGLGREPEPRGREPESRGGEPEPWARAVALGGEAAG